jgi:BlaI family penicillinase repressor
MQAVIESTDVHTINQMELPESPGGPATWESIALPAPRLTAVEVQIMEILWRRGASAVREIQEALPGRKRPYTSVQNFIYRLEAKQAVSRVKKISTAHIWEASIVRQEWERQLVEELLAQFGGRSAPLLAHLLNLGKLTLDQLRELEKECLLDAVPPAVATAEEAASLSDIERQLNKLNVLWRRWKSDHSGSADRSVSAVE